MILLAISLFYTYFGKNTEDYICLNGYNNNTDYVIQNLLL